MDKYKENNFENTFLYKYRSFKDLEYFLDILIYKRLYSSLYKELNDPMEGFFMYDESLDREVVNLIRNEKTKTYICSLSKNCNNGLMWSMYADSHKGCCIELFVTSNSWEKCNVKYNQNIFQLDNNQDVFEVLSCKSRQWLHEEEVRYIKNMQSKDKRPELKIMINKVILGTKVNSHNRSFYKKIIQAIDSNIQVSIMKQEDIDFGYIKF